MLKNLRFLYRKIPMIFAFAGFENLRAWRENFEKCLRILALNSEFIGQMGYRLVTYGVTLIFFVYLCTASERRRRILPQPSGGIFFVKGVYELADIDCRWFL